MFFVLLLLVDGHLQEFSKMLANPPTSTTVAPNPQKNSFPTAIIPLHALSQAIPSKPCPFLFLANNQCGKLNNQLQIIFKITSPITAPLSCHPSTPSSSNRAKKDYFLRGQPEKNDSFINGALVKIFQSQILSILMLQKSRFPTKHIYNFAYCLGLEGDCKSRAFPTIFRPTVHPYKIENRTIDHISTLMSSSLSPTQPQPQFNCPNPKYIYLLSLLTYIKRGNTPQQIQQFFVQRANMHIQINYSLFRDDQLSLFGDQDDHYQNQVDLLMDKQRIPISSRIQNSIYEMEEILNHFTYDSPLQIKNDPTDSNSTLRPQKSEGVEKCEEENSRKKGKKIKKSTNSPFHNYQKHLNNALKKLIIVPEFESSDGNYKSAAIEIWKAYQKSQVKTKRILHFVFNERNEHAINDPQLKNYGLWNVYQSHSEQTISHAKTYLSKLAIDQLDDQNIEGYLKTRKLKSKIGFKEYIVSFKSELEGGYLKRRINIDKALN